MFSQKPAKNKNRLGIGWGFLRVVGFICVIAFILILFFGGDASLYSYPDRGDDRGDYQMHPIAMTIAFFGVVCIGMILLSVIWIFADAATSTIRKWRRKR